MQNLIEIPRHINIIEKDTPHYCVILPVLPHLTLPPALGSIWADLSQAAQAAFLRTKDAPNCSLYWINVTRNADQPFHTWVLENRSGSSFKDFEKFILNLVPDEHQKSFVMISASISALKTAIALYGKRAEQVPKVAKKSEDRSPKGDSAALLSWQRYIAKVTGK